MVDVGLGKPGGSIAKKDVPYTQEKGPSPMASGDGPFSLGKAG